MGEEGGTGHKSGGVSSGQEAWEPPGPKGLRLGTGMNGILKCVSPAVSELPLVAERGVTPLAREPAGEGLDLQKGTLVSRSRSGSGPVGIGV
jgi:hypothetical protein